MPVTVVLPVSPTTRPVAKRIRDTAVTPSTCSIGFVMPAGSGEKPSSWVTMLDGLDLLVDALVDRRAQPGGEDRHEHDERDADHQRRGGDRGALRLAAGVLAGEHAREALEARQRAPDQAAQRAHERRGQQREAEDHQQRAEAEHGRGRARGARVAEQPVEQQRDADRLDDDGGDDPPPAHAPDAGRDAVAHRRHGLDPRRAAGGHEARDDGGDDADDQAGDRSVRGSSTVLVVPRSIPNEASSAARPGASARPAAMPSSDASTPITNVSASTERSTWPREAPSVRSSANSFVRCATVTLKVLKIRKRADEQRHRGEHEQRRADEAERVREVLRLLLGLLLAGAHGELPPQLARDRGLELLRRRPARGGDGDVVVAVVAGHAPALLRA